MSFDVSAQLSMLNQKVDILTREFNEVLNEIQVTTQGLAKMSSAALKVHGFQIMELQKQLREVAAKAGLEVKFAGEENATPTSTIVTK